MTASYDKTARVWDAESGKPVGEPMAHRSAVNSAAFSPDGKRVVTASSDGTARVWDQFWSSMAHDGHALRQAACARMNTDARRLTADDVRVARVLSAEQIGQDVCRGAKTDPLSK